jgi:hypothetical protein
VAAMQIRRARWADEKALKQIDLATWTTDSSPAPAVLREEFHLDGRYVDDVLMARDLTAR